MNNTHVPRGPEYTCQDWKSETGNMLAINGSNLKVGASDGSFIKIDEVMITWNLPLFFNYFHSYFAVIYQRVSALVGLKFSYLHCNV